MNTRSDRLARRTAAVLCAVALGWALVLPLAPRVAAGLHGAEVRPGAWVLYGLGSLICHQLPDRSFHTAGVPWPVCGRCAGLYLSGALGIAVALVARGRVRAPASAGRKWRALLIAAALPTLMSWAFERLGWWAPASETRALLAVPLGAAIGAVLASVASARSPGDARD